MKKAENEADEDNDLEVEEAKRANLLSRCIFLFLTQSFLTVVVGKEVVVEAAVM